MKKWTMLLALLLATVFCFPGALAEQEAVESTGDNGGGQLVSHVYEPGDIASGLLAQAFGQEHGTMIVAEVRGEGIPLEAEMPDLVLRLGVAFSQGARLELGLRESQENVGFDIALDADAQGLAIASDLLPDERYTMKLGDAAGNESGGNDGRIARHAGNADGADGGRYQRIGTADGAVCRDR